MLSYNFEAVHGFTFGVDAIKSILLMCAVVDKRITVEEAVRLSRLEVDFQVTLNCRQGSGLYACVMKNNSASLKIVFFRWSIGETLSGLIT